MVPTSESLDYDTVKNDRDEEESGRKGEGEDPVLMGADPEEDSGAVLMAG